MSGNAKKSGSSRQGQATLASHQLNELLEKDDLDSFKKYLDNNGVGANSAAQLLRQLCDKGFKGAHEFHKISLVLEYVDQRNPFFFDQNPEDCPVVRAFEANKQEIFKLLMKKPAKHSSQSFERIIQTLLYQALSKYDKQKPICQILFRLLAENGPKGIVNRMKDGLLFINEAIRKNDPELVQEIIQSLHPNLTIRDGSGSSAVDLSQEPDCHPEIARLVMVCLNGDRKRGGAAYDLRDQHSGSNIANQPYQGNYGKRGDARYGDEPNSPSRSNAQAGNGLGTYESGGTKRKKEPLNTIIVGTQQGATPISLTVSGAQNAQKGSKGQPKHARADNIGSNQSQTGRVMPVPVHPQSSGHHIQEHPKRTSNGGKDDSKKIMGYVPENLKLIQMKDGQKKVHDKKKTRNQGYNLQHYEDSREGDSEAYSQGKHMYQSDHYSKYGPSPLDTQYDYKDSSQRGGKKIPSQKDEQQSLNSRNKYDQKERSSRQMVYGEGDEISGNGGSNKQERHNYYGSKYPPEDPHKGYMNSNYIYNQPDYSKGNPSTGSGSKRGTKGEEHLGQRGSAKQGYMQGSHKKDVEVNNIMINAPQPGYFQQYHPYGHMPMGQSYPSSKKGHKYYEMDYGNGEDIMDAADVGEQDKLAQLMHLGKTSEDHPDPFDRRGHPEQFYSQYGKK